MHRQDKMFTFLLICTLTSLLTLGHASLPLVINTWPFKNAAAAGRPIFYTTMNCVRQKKERFIQAGAQSRDTVV